MRDYGINNSLAATDPECVVVFEEKYRRLIVTLAERNGVWAYGWDYKYKDGGSGAAPVFKEGRDLHATREGALHAALRYWKREIPKGSFDKMGQLDLFGGAI